MADALPPLTGTDKQIAWANDLRTLVIANAAAGRQQLIDDDPHGEDVDYTQRALADHDARLAWVLTHTAAAWWLDPTHRSWRQLNTLAKAALHYRAQAGDDLSQLDPAYR